MTNRFIAVARFTDEDEENSYGHRGKAARDYEYLLPESATGSEKFAVVTPSSRTTLGDMKLVRIKEIKSVAEQEFPGDLKPVVAAFDTDEFLVWSQKLAKRKSLMVQIEKKVSERSKIAQLEALAGDDPDARMLLDALKAL